MDVEGPVELEGQQTCGSRWSKIDDGRLEKCLPAISPNPKSLKSKLGCAAADPPELGLAAERSFQSSLEGEAPSTWTSETFCGH